MVLRYFNILKLNAMSLSKRDYTLILQYLNIVNAMTVQEKKEKKNHDTSDQQTANWTSNEAFVVDFRQNVNNKITIFLYQKQKELCCSSVT